MKTFPIGIALAAMLPSPASAQAAEPASAALAKEAEAVPLSLDEAVQLAVSRSFRTARARRNAESSELRAGNAKAGYLPRVDFGLTGEAADRLYEQKGLEYEPYDSYRLARGGIATNLWLPVDVSGVVRRQVRQAETQAKISRYEVEQTALDIAFEAQNNYLNALKAQEMVAADARVVDEIASLLDRTRSTLTGVVPFLQVELANAQQALTNSQANADQSQDALKQVLRIPLETRLRLTTAMTHDGTKISPANQLERAMAQRPDVQQAKLRIKQAETAAKQVTDSLRPSLGISGYYNRDMAARTLSGDERGRILNRGLAVNLKVPLFQYDGGQNNRQRQIAAIQQDQAVADAQELEERVAYDLRQALLAVERAENRIKSLPNKAQAFAALKRAEQQMLAAPPNEAQSLLAQVSNARSAWRSAETASADAHIEYNRALFRLKRTLGETEVADPVSARRDLPTVPIVQSGGAL